MRIYLFIVMGLFSILGAGIRFLTMDTISNLIDTPASKYIIMISALMLTEVILNSLAEYIKRVSSIKEVVGRDRRLINKSVCIDYSFHESQEYNDKLEVFRTTFEDETGKINSFCEVVTGVCTIVMFCFFLLKNMSVINSVINIMILVSFLLLSGAAEYKNSTYMYDYWEDYKKNTRLYNRISDIFVKRDYVLERKFFNFTNFFIEKFDSEFDSALKKNKKAGKKRMILELKSELCVVLFFMFEIVYLVILKFSDKVTLGAVTAILTFSASIFLIISEGLYAIPDLLRMIKNKKELDTFLYNNLEDSTEYLPQSNQENDTCISIKNLSFYYEKGKIIFDNFNFEIKKGKHYAIVGQNGIGKTTLVKLISGLYKPAKGVIKVNGTVVALFQDYNKYPYSMRENIFLGENEMESEKNLMFEFDDGIFMDSKLTNMNDDGIEISGGQWQKVALERILAHKADIIILDEPTSNLDPLVEAKIYDEYIKKFEGKTLIVITHRLGFLSDFDQIVVLGNEGVIETGTHSELIKNKDSFYKKMFDKQKEHYEKKTIV